MCSIIFFITFKNVFAGILLVGPDPPIPKIIFVSSLFILNLKIVFSIVFLSIWILGSSNIFVLISDGTNQSLVDYLKKKRIKYTNINQLKFNLNNRIKKIKACNQIGKLVLNSSGTTGEPKKILIEIDKLWTNGKLFSNLYTFINKETIFLNFLPMSYLGGLFNL